MLNPFNIETNIVNVKFKTKICKSGYNMNSEDVIVFDKKTLKYLNAYDLDGTKKPIDIKTNENFYDSTEYCKDIVLRTLKAREYVDRNMLNYIYHNIKKVAEGCYNIAKADKGNMVDSLENYTKMLEGQINQYLNYIVDRDFKKNYVDVVYLPKENDITGII